MGDSALCPHIEECSRTTVLTHKDMEEDRSIVQNLDLYNAIHD